MELLLLIQLLAVAGIYAYQHFLAPKPDVQAAKKAKYGDYTFPRASEGSPIPVFWGTVKFKGPNVIWVAALDGEPRVQDQNGQAVTIGYNYRIAMQMVLGIPPADGITPRLRRMWIGERVSNFLQPNGLHYGNCPETPDVGRVFFLLAPGNPPGSGNDASQATGAVAWMPGTFTQTQHPEVITLYGREDGPTFDETLLPAHRGQCVVTLFEVENPNHPTLRPTRGFKVGHSPSMEGYAFEVAARGDSSVLGEALSSIGDDMNPVLVLYDLLTASWGKVGYTASQIDLPSFLAAAQQLVLEQHGFSMILYNPAAAGDLISEIRQQIDAELYQDQDDGKVHIKLIREDYTIGDLPVFNPSNVVEILDHGKSTPSESFNVVHVVFTDRNKNYNENTATAMNEAAIAAADNVVRSTTYNFPGINDAYLAAAVATRQLNALSLPLTRVRMAVNRDAIEVKPGDAIVLDWPEFGIEEMVLRVKTVGFGELDDNRMVLDCLQDRFAVDHVATDLPDWWILPLASPTIITDHYATEAPRWLLRKAWAEGALTDADLQHGYYLAAPEGLNVTYTGWVSVDGATDLEGNRAYSTDTQSLSFPSRTAVLTEYPRTTEAYDVTTDLVVEYDAGLADLLSTATAADIRAHGKNMILVGDEDSGHYEFMAFENFSVNVGVSITFTEVWRGLLDTPPADHPVGTRVFLLSPAWTGAIGGTAFNLDSVVDVRVVPRAGLVAGSVDDAETTSVTIRLRTLLPYAPSDLKLNAAKVPADLEEEGVDVTWKQRERTKVSIKRGDDASDVILDATTRYDVMGRNLGDAWTVIHADVNDDQKDDLRLGMIGHGDIEVGVRASRDNPDTDSATTTLYSWDDAALTIYAERWRNMLLNPRFAVNGLEHWSFVNDEVQGSNAAVGLGLTGSYLTTNGSRPMIAAQTADVSGFIPYRLRALLDFYARNYNADVDDTTTVVVRQLDSVGATLVDTTYGPVAQSSTLWAHLNVDVANLHTDCHSIQVRLTGTRVGGVITNIAITECILRVGQISNQLLLNENFSGGLLTSWTQTLGTWAAGSTTRYVDGFYVTSGNAFTNELRQSVNLPAGFTYGTAVCEYAQMRSTANLNTGHIILEALDVSSNVIATATLAASSPAVINTWERKRLTLDFPDLTTQIRIRVIGTRVGGASTLVHFDDFNLRVHKDLDVTWTKVLELDEPTQQQLPQTTAEWDAAHPTVAAPDYAMWAGNSLDGIIGNEPYMPSDDVFIGKFVGVYDGESMVTEAMEFPVGGTELTTSNVRFANFKSAEGFTVDMVFKTDPSVATQNCGLIERQNTTGWSMQIADDGWVSAYLHGAAGSANANSAALVNDGGVHRATMIYDPDTDLLRLIVDGVATSASTAAIGEFKCDELVNLIIGADVDMPFQGQIARINIWRRALSVAEAQALWSHADDPTGGDVTYNRAQTMSVVVGEDDDGVLVGAFGSHQVAVGYNPAYATTGETGFGLAFIPDNGVENIVPTNDMTDATTWVNLGATIAYPEISGPTGHRKVTRITGDNTDWLALNFTHGTASIYAATSYFIRADVAHDSRCVIYSDANGIRETFTVPVTTTWQRVDKITALWNGADVAGGEVRFVPSTDGTVRTIDIAGPFYIGRTNIIPQCIPEPLGTAIGVDAEYLATLPIRFNHEGEVVFEGICKEAAPAAHFGLALVQIDNNNDFNDYRALVLETTTSNPILEHGDSAGTALQGEGTAAAIDLDGGFIVRGRWNRAGLLDGAASFATVLLGSTTSSDVGIGRAATWTASDVPMEVVRIGQAESSIRFNGLVRRITLNARESRLPVT